MSIAPQVLLNNGKTIPAIGLGTYKAPIGVVKEAVKCAIDAGYRHFDCAFFYKNEEDVGEGIKHKIAEGIVKREDVFVTSKLWSNCHAFTSVVPACKKSLKLLQLDYLDLYLIHWPMAFQEGCDLMPEENGEIKQANIDYLETWKGMEECVALGLVKSIGVSNFNSEQIDRLLASAKIKPVMNQVECNPNINQLKLIDFCRQRGIKITAYCPLGKAAEARDRPNAPAPSIDDPTIKEFGIKYNKTPAQVILRYLHQINTIPIPKSVTPHRIKENIEIFDFELNADEMSYINSLNKNQRLALMDNCTKSEYYPFNIEF